MGVAEGVKVVETIAANAPRIMEKLSLAWASRGAMLAGAAAIAKKGVPFVKELGKWTVLSWGANQIINKLQSESDDPHESDSAVQAIKSGVGLDPVLNSLTGGLISVFEAEADGTSAQEAFARISLAETAISAIVSATGCSKIQAVRMVYAFEVVRALPAECYGVAVRSESR